MELLEKISAELRQAEIARLTRNEGRARVCARRAAGLAARDFLNRRSIRTHHGGAYEALQTLAKFPGLAPELKQAAVHLTMRLTEDFSLPEGLDLITEARRLCKCLGNLS